MTGSPLELDAVGLIDAFARRALSPVDAIDAAAERIEATAELNAYWALDLDRARDAARAAEAAYARGEPRPLEGVPVAVKDLFDTAGVRTTYGSAIYRDHVPDRDADAVRLLIAAGAIMVAKTSTNEFAWGIDGENPHFGDTRNPWAPQRVAGGSSAGSAVAVAVGAVPIALGSDTGGSIRAPASFCGIAGLRTTLGRVSSRGVFPLAPTLDTVGPMARTPRDLGLALGVLARPIPDDPSTAPMPASDYRAAADAGPPARVGTCPDLHTVELEPAVRAALDASLAALADAGSEIVEVPFAQAAHVREAFAPIQRAEALHVHRAAGLWPRHAADYDPAVAGRIRDSERVSLADYLEANDGRRRVTGAFLRAFEGADAIVIPAAAVGPRPIGDDAGADREGVSFRDGVMSCTRPASLAGLPAGVVRAGTDAEGVPVGVQVIARPWAEATALAALAALERAVPPEVPPDFG